MILQLSRKPSDAIIPSPYAAREWLLSLPSSNACCASEPSDILFVESGREGLAKVTSRATCRLRCCCLSCVKRCPICRLLLFFSLFVREDMPLADSFSCFPSHFQQHQISCPMTRTSICPHPVKPSCQNPIFPPRAH